MDTIFDTKHLYRTYFKMALPVVLGLVVTLIYNLADTFVAADLAGLCRVRQGGPAVGHDAEIRMADSRVCAFDYAC